MVNGALLDPEKYELELFGIENKDGTIGFYSRDAEKVDAIGFAAIGAYAARN